VRDGDFLGRQAALIGVGRHDGSQCGRQCQSAENLAIFGNQIKTGSNVINGIATKWKP